MNDMFIFRILLVVVVAIILFALVTQYYKNKQQEHPHPSSSSSSSRRQPGPSRSVDGPRYGPAADWEKFDPASEHYLAQESLQAPEKTQFDGAKRLDVPTPEQPHFSSSRVSSMVGGGKQKEPRPFESVDTEIYRAVDFQPESNKKATSEYFPQDRTTAQDLLPGKDAANSKWAQVNPAGQGDLMNVNLLNAGFHMGVNTQSQTMRNPNLQVRSEFPNPKADVGPWNSSTIESDHDRRYFELGEP
jgi:hypothetical protein